MVFRVEALQPVMLLAREPNRLSRFDNRDIILGVASLKGIKLAFLGQPLGGIFANSLQHRKARLAAGRVLLMQEALVKQKTEVIESIYFRHLTRHRFIAY